MPVLVGSIFILGLFSVNKKIGFMEGLIFLGVFSIYLLFLFRKRKDKKIETAPLSGSLSFWKDLLILSVGFVLLFFGSSLAVDSSLHLVEVLSLSERFAGVFILSFSTSLPELATSLQAAFKKEGGMALGNIVGSNLFNTLFVLGSASVISPLYFSVEFYYDYIFMFLVTLILWFVLLLFKNIPKVIFSFFVVSYFLYIAFVSGAFG